jgi:hypothetical protein
MREEKHDVSEADSLCGGRSSTTTEHDKISERRNRSADFQAAWRGLLPLVGADHENAGRRLSQEILERLQALDEHVRSIEDSPSDAKGAVCEAESINYALDQIDTDLDQYATLLCRHLEKATQNPSSGHFYPIKEADRGGITALLDVILEVDPRMERYGGVFDILVTILSTAEQDGLRRIIQDPAALTPKLHSLAERAETSSDLDLSKAEQNFVGAAQRAGESLSDELIREMHALKGELGGSILAPQVLRSAVFFNVAAWNAGRGAGACEPSQNPSAPGDTNASEIQPPIAAEAGDTPTRDAHATAGSSLGGAPELRLDISAGPSHAPHPARDAPDVSEVQWRIKPGPPETRTAPRPKDARDEFRTRLRLYVTVSGLAAVLLLVTQLWWSGSGGTVQPLSEDDLREVSTHLDSGYRSDFGSGPLFIGTVGNEWQYLSTSDQRRSADEIISRLGESGAREILIYDDQRRIALHSAVGLPLRIADSVE